MDPTQLRDSRDFFNAYNIIPNGHGQYNPSAATTMAGSSTPPRTAYLQPQQQHRIQQHVTSELGISASISATSSPHYSSSVASPMQSSSSSFSDHQHHHQHQNQNGSYPGTPISVPLPLPSNHSSGYLDAYSNISMGNIMPMEMDTPLGIDIAMLSSQHHRDYQLLEEHRRRQRAAVAPGRAGLGREREMSAESSESISAAGGRRGKGAAAAGGKKSRGRPRLDTNDESAADRRRTQIRLAQRAYRMRKETTIASLRTRVEELEKSLDEMQALFHELHDAALNHDHVDKDAYRESIGKISDRFQALQAPVSTADGDGESNHDDDGEQETNDDSSKPSKTVKPSQHRRRSHDSNDGTGSGGAWCSGLANMTPQPTASSWGYPTSHARSTGGAEENRVDGGPSSPPTRTHARSHSYPSTTLVMTPAIVAPIAIPQLLDEFTYTLHDATFSSRLHRSALKYALKALTDPNADQSVADRIFAYTFCYRTREEVASSLKAILCDSRSITSPAVDYAAFQASRRHPHNDELRREAYSQLIKMGINQKFLRPDDVEKLLTNAGILRAPSFHMPGEMDFDLFDFPDDSDGQQSQCSDEPVEKRFGSPEQDELLGLFGGNKHSDLATEEELRPHGMPLKFSQGVRKPIIEDVLIAEIAKYGVCMGPYPAFRKSDIEEAVRVATAKSVAARG